MTPESWKVVKDLTASDHSDICWEETWYWKSHFGSKYNTYFDYLQMANVGKFWLLTLWKLVGWLSAEKRPDVCGGVASNYTFKMISKTLNSRISVDPWNFERLQKVQQPKTVQESLSESLFDALSILEVVDALSILEAVVLQTSSSKNVKSGKFLIPDLEIRKRSNAGGSSLYLLRDTFHQNLHLRSAEV